MTKLFEREKRDSLSHPGLVEWWYQEVDAVTGKTGFIVKATKFGVSFSGSSNLYNNPFSLDELAKTVAGAFTDHMGLKSQKTIQGA